MNSRDENSAETNGVPAYVLRRVRALRARAEHRNTPDAERETSRRLAAELLARYSLAPDTATEKAGKATVDGSRRPRRRSTAWYVAVWVRFHLVELIAVAVPLALAATVSLWFLVLAALLGLWWTVVEYRVARDLRRERSAG